MGDGKENYCRREERGREGEGGRERERERERERSDLE
jgi:hypothetical protein